MTATTALAPSSLYNLLTSVLALPVIVPAALQATMGTNHSFSRLTRGWISRKFKAIFGLQPTISDPELEAVFDAPKNFANQFGGTKNSRSNQKNRMKFVAQIAGKFNYLMLKRRSDTGGEIKK
jgi:hypothetical protein